MLGRGAEGNVGARSADVKNDWSAERRVILERGAMIQKRPERGALMQK